MRKSVLSEDSAEKTSKEPAWWDIDQLATVEVSSEHPDHPIEAALIPGSGSFWQAAKPGPQKVRIKFDQPQRVSRIGLLFQEAGRERTQEFVVRWLSANDSAFQEVVRQQFNFSASAPTEREEYTVALSGVAAVELEIVPDIRDRNAVATLARFCIA
jgi:hypothetical protein